MTVRLFAALLLLLAGPAWAASTGAKTPTSCPPVTSSAGDNDGWEGVTSGSALSSSNCTAVASSNDVRATDNNTNTASSTDGCGTFPQSEADQHDFHSYTFGVPAGATIDGIIVTIEGLVDSVTNNPRICVGLSWDGGTTWTAAKDTGVIAATDAVYTLGGAADTWGRTWSTSELADGTFKVRTMTEVDTGGTRDFQLDHITVEIHYTEAGAGCAPRLTLLGVGC